MIELKVRDYCHDCPMFEADVKTVYSNDIPVAHYISCTRSEECRHIIQYISDNLVFKIHGEQVSVAMKEKEK